MTNRRPVTIRSAWLTLALVGLGHGPMTFAADPPRASADLVCGPRCIQFILHHYGQEADLIDLVKEAQWPDLEAGASLDRIQKCLNIRGIHTAAIRFDPGRQFRWPSPVLLYTDEGDPARGHYVVRLPGASPDHDDLVWAGVEGWRRGQWEDVTRGFSGLALLTSPEPITDVDAALGPLPPSSLLRIAGLAGAGAIVAHLLLRSRRRLRERSRYESFVSPR